MWTMVLANSRAARIRGGMPSGCIVVDDQSGVPLWAGASPMSDALVRIYHQGFEYALPCPVNQVKEHRVRGRKLEMFVAHLSAYLGLGDHMVVTLPWSGAVPGCLGLTQDLQPCELDGAFERLNLKELISGN